MIEYETFLAKYYPDANEARKDDVKRFIDNFLAIIGKTPFEEALTNRSLLCKSFFIQGACGVSRSHYQKIKGYLVCLFDMYGVNGAVPSREEVVDSQENISMFRSLDEMLGFIDKVGQAVLGDRYNPTTDLVIMKSICVLGWHGFSLSEIVDMKRSDLHMVNLDRFILTRKNMTYEITGASFAALFYLCDLNSYKSLPNGKLMVLDDSEYLFRSAPPIRVPKLSENAIVHTIMRFNDNIPPYYQRTILFRNLRKNALFLEIYNDKSDKAILPKIASIMGCDQVSAINYKQQYLRFVEALEAGDI